MSGWERKRPGNVLEGEAVGLVVRGSCGRSDEGVHERRLVPVIRGVRTTPVHLDRFQDLGLL